jgi:hypothetical protein
MHHPGPISTGTSRTGIPTMSSSSWRRAASPNVSFVECTSHWLHWLVGTTTRHFAGKGLPATDNDLLPRRRLWHLEFPLWYRVHPWSKCRHSSISGDHSHPWMMTGRPFTQTYPRRISAGQWSLMCLHVRELTHGHLLCLSQCIQHPVPVLHSRLYYSLTITNAQDQSSSNQDQRLGHTSEMLSRLQL